MESNEELRMSEEQSTSITAKLVNILTAPTLVFHSIRERLSWQDWAVPFLIAVLVSGIVGIVNAPHTLEFSKDAMRAQQEKFMGRDMSDSQREQIRTRFQDQMEKQEARYTPPKVYYWSFGRSALGIGFPLLVIAMLYYFAGNTVLGKQAPFESVLAVVALPQMVKVIQSLYELLLTQILGTAQVPQSLAALLPYGAAEVFSMERYHQAIFTLLSQINVFTLWRLVLFTLGFMIIYRVSRGKAIGVVFGYWLIWLVITTAGSFFLAGLT